MYHLSYSYLRYIVSKLHFFLSSSQVDITSLHFYFIRIMLVCLELLFFIYSYLQFGHQYNFKKCFNSSKFFRTIFVPWGTNFDSTIEPCAMINHRL